MTAATIASALQRARRVFGARPDAAIHPDQPAIARWEQGMRVVCRHASGPQVATNMPAELGGEGDQVSPGWLLRAAMASCLATRIVMEAAEREIVVTRLEVEAASTSDVRGLLGMTDAAGKRLPAEPLDVTLQVRIAASNVPADRLQALVADSFRCSPVSAAVERSIPVSLLVDTNAP